VPVRAKAPRRKQMRTMSPLAGTYGSSSPPKSNLWFRVADACARPPVRGGVCRDLCKNYVSFCPMMLALNGQFIGRHATARVARAANPPLAISLWVLGERVGRRPGRLRAMTVSLARAMIECHCSADRVGDRIVAAIVVERCVSGGRVDVWLAGGRLCCGDGMGRRQPRRRPADHRGRGDRVGVGDRGGLEIRLAPGWHTYWRSPGEADQGAPRLDFDCRTRCSSFGGLRSPPMPDCCLFENWMMQSV
jgi:hypothetical protein